MALTTSGFQKKAEDILREKFVPPPYSTVAEFATARNRFKQERLRAAINLAEQNAHLRDAQIKKRLWEKRLSVLQGAIERLGKSEVVF